MEPVKETEEKAGYLVLRVKLREGVVINQGVEVRLAAIDPKKGEAQIAIRAPKSYPIRRVK